MMKNTIAICLQRHCNLQKKFQIRCSSMCADMLGALREDSPLDLILLDIVMPLMSGIEAIPFIKSLAPMTDIVMLTGFDEDEKIFSSISIGAIGYLLKASPTNKIVERIEEVLNGGAAMSPSIAKKSITNVWECAGGKFELRFNTS
jgi:DNA-binding NarL/FixJ family response regulator